MANAEQLEILKQGVKIWNKWRAANPETVVHLSRADLKNFDLSMVNLSGCYLEGTILKNTDLSDANLSGAQLGETNLQGAVLKRTNLSKAWLIEANLSGANLDKADLTRAFLESAFLRSANLTSAILREARLTVADLVMANLTGADLTGAVLNGANLSGADLTEANLSEAELAGATFMRTEVHRAKISGSFIYGINVWDLKGEFEEQKDLVITPPEVPTITVDSIEVAQFVYLILNNEKIRDVIDTLTSKSVLILGRFTQERKVVLDSLKNKLREYNLLPILFDFDRSEDKDFTETIQTLAGLCYFVIADITSPKSSPLELQATVPNIQVPFVPILQEGEQPFAMMVDLQKKYNWVLDTLSYSSIDTLIKALKPAIIDPAIQKHNELRLIKAREPKIRSATDFIDDKGLE
jgi:uncharacterized protein YjbI with pentapeptide repeats